MDLTQKNFKEVFIMGDVAASSAVGGIDTMVAGEVALFAVPSNLRIVSASAGTGEILGTGTDKAVLVKKLSDGTIQRSDIIDKNFVTSVKSAAYAAKTEQIDYIGFNGTSGDLEATNDNLFFVRFMFKNLTVSNYRGDYYKHLQYNSPVTGTTKTMVADGLALSASLNFSKKEDTLVKVERVSGEAGDAIAGTATALTFVKGSKVVAIDGTITTAGLSGGYIRIGTGVTDPVYKVVSYTASDNITLDVPYQGDSATVLVANAEVVTAADFEAAGVGLKVTGLPLSSDPGKFTPANVRWEIGLDSDSWTSAVTVTKAQAPDLGQGTEELVAMDEFQAQGSQRSADRYTRESYSSRSEASGNYNTVSLEFRDESEVGSPRPVSHKQVTIYAVDGASADSWTKANDGLQAALNSFLGESISLS